jgi:uncharacterized protein
MPHQVHCPTCGRPIDWSEATPYRPFCSERCRLIDFGAWLSEEHRIPAESSQEQTGPAQPGESEAGEGGSEH